MGILTILGFIAGLALLVAGADMLVRGASRLAAAFGVAPVIIGLTVVAYGTSAPELAVSLRASLAGNPDIALGNVVGSNICNVLLILGLAALAAPLIVERRLLRYDVPLMIVVSSILWWMASDGSVSRWEGGILVLGMLLYTLMVLRESRAVSMPEAEELTDLVQEYVEPEDRTRVPWFKDGAFIVAGLGALVLGANLVVGSAMVFARAMGISELVIGLTIVAVGTSLPEMVTSFVAALRGERDIAVGNVVGSNLFNILAVLGLSAAISGRGVAVAPAAVSFDIPVMIAVALLCAPIFWTRMTIARWEGILLLGLYGAYTTFLVLSANTSSSLDTFGNMMLWGVFPAVFVVLVVSVIRSHRADRMVARG